MTRPAAGRVADAEREDRRTLPAMEISRTAFVASSPQAAYELVSDLPRMGELSLENEGGRWLGGATGPARGTRFRGHNRNGWRRWSTTARVEFADPGRDFTFRVGFWGVPVSRWSYVIADAEGGCTLTESWTDRRPWWFKGPAGLTTGVMDREAATALSIEHTLARVKATLES
jgi:hypothetical protein